MTFHLPPRFRSLCAPDAPSGPDPDSRKDEATRLWKTYQDTNTRRAPKAPKIAMGLLVAIVILVLLSGLWIILI